MAVAYMNGFEWNNMAENISAYAGASLQSRTAGAPVRSGDYSIYIGNGQWFEFLLPSNLSEFYLQFAFFLPQYYTGTSTVLSWRFGSDVISTLAFDGTAQHFKFFTGTGAGTLRLTTSTTIIQNRWYYVELHVIIDPVSGLFEFRIDGVPDSSYSGPTQPGSDPVADRIRFDSASIAGGWNTSPWFYLDDIVVNDTTGTTNNSWVGCLSVLLLRPWGLGSSERWDKTSPTALNNYECVDGAPNPNPTEFIYTEYGGKLDLYLIEDLPAEAYSVEAIRADAWACKTSGSSRNIEVAIDTNSTTYISSTFELDMYYSLYGSYWEQNPSGTTHWSITDINAIEAGVRSSF